MLGCKKPGLEILTLFVIIKSSKVLLCGVIRVGSSMSCFKESEEQRSLILDDKAACYNLNLHK